MSDVVVEGDPSLRVIAVVGPTAVGKSALAEDLATALHGEIVSADSMQVYVGMDIGTAKPPAARRNALYHCVDLAEPGAGYSAALFQRDARDAIAEIAGRGKVPIVAGGTGLYVRAALDDMRFPDGELESEERSRLEAEAQTLGAQAMHERLSALDPESAALIHPNNVRRTIRALEMAAQGASYASQAAGFSDRRSVYDASYIGLTMDRERLYASIDARVDRMLAAGLLGEIERLLDAGFRDALTAAQAIGYKEFVPVIEHGSDVHQAAEMVRQATRRYAKRQLSWFRQDPRVRWIDVTDSSSEAIVERALHLLESSEPAPYPHTADTRS